MGLAYEEVIDFIAAATTPGKIVALHASDASKLRYRAGRDAAVKFGEALFSGQLGKLEYISKNDQQKVWQLFNRDHDHCFSFTDCTSFVIAERLKIDTAIALDSDFRSYGLIYLSAG